jgi:hypothetical protein
LYAVIDPDGTCAFNTIYTASQRPHLSISGIALTPERDMLETRHSLLIHEERNNLTTFIEDRLDYLQSLTHAHTFEQLNANIKEVLPSATSKTQRLLEWLREPVFNDLIHYPKTSPASSTTSAQANWPTARELLAIAHDEQITIFLENSTLGSNHYKMEIETTQPNYESYFTIPIITTALQRCNLYTLKNGHFYPLPSTHYEGHLKTALAKLTDIVYTTFKKHTEPTNTDQPERQPPNPPDHKHGRNQIKPKTQPTLHTQTEMFQFLYDILPQDPATELLRVETSKLPKAGRGAFAKATIQHAPTGKPTKIATYKAYSNNPQKEVTYEELTHPDYKTEYGFTDKTKNIAVDPYDHTTNTPLCLAAYMNDPLDPKKWNAQFKITKNDVIIVTTKTIGKGQEIYLQYGAHYWNDPKHPTQLIRKAMLAYNIFSLDETWTETLKAAEQRDQLTTKPRPRIPMATPQTTYNALTGKTHTIRTQDQKLKTKRKKPKKPESILEILTKKRTLEKEPTTTLRKPETQREKRLKTQPKGTEPDTQQTNPQAQSTAKASEHTPKQATEAQKEAGAQPKNNTEETTQPRQIHNTTDEEQPPKQLKRNRENDEQSSTTTRKRRYIKRNHHIGTAQINQIFHVIPQAPNQGRATSAEAPQDQPDPPPERDGIG